MNLLQKRVTLASFAAAVLANARHHPDVVNKEGTFSWEAFVNLTDNGHEGFDDIAQKMNAMQEEIDELKAKLAEASGDFVEKKDDQFHAKIFIESETYPEWEQDGYLSLEEARNNMLREARNDSDIFGSDSVRFEIVAQRNILALQGRLSANVTINIE